MELMKINHRVIYRCQTSRNRRLHATVASIWSGNASKVAEARKLRSRYFPVNVREGRGRRTVDQIQRVRRSHNAITTSMLYKRHLRCLTNVHLKHFEDMIYNPALTNLLISLTWITERLIAFYVELPFLVLIVNYLYNEIR